jgi:hypothetical protein
MASTTQSKGCSRELEIYDRRRAHKVEITLSINPMLMEY